MLTLTPTMLAQTTQVAVDNPGWWVLGVFFVFAVGMLIWDTIEVGRNDAANLVNAVYGARLMTRAQAVRIAGIATIIGAMLSSGVIETARKGIFDPRPLEPMEAVTIYVSVYVVDTVLLYAYSAFGMQVSTTACLVFELLGASLAMSLIRSYDKIVMWSKAGTVVSAIIVSIFLAGFMAFVAQRLLRGIIRDRAEDLRTMRLHGPWIGGGMATGLFFFMILKGAKAARFVTWINDGIKSLDDWIKAAMWEGDPASAADINFGNVIVLLAMWLFFGLVISMLLGIYRERAAKRMFPTLAILGMIAMAVAFGQNDLANCASPGLATITLIQHWDKGTAQASKMSIPWYLLFACGFMLYLGMRTKNATRVTKTAVRTGSQTDRVGLYAPHVFIAIAQRLVTHRPGDASLAPSDRYTERGKRMHFDPMRASVIMCISASVIAMASSYKLPVSTTYVTFAAIVGSGMGDRIFQQGDAALKLARAMWIVFSWFLAAVIAAFFTGIICSIIHFLSVWGLALTLAINLYMRRIFKLRGDAQARRTREELMERRHPERYATEEDY